MQILYTFYIFRIADTPFCTIILNFCFAYQTAANPSKTTNSRSWAFNDMASLDGALVVEAAPVALDSALPVGELEPEVGLELPVLVDEPVFVDMLVIVEARVVIEDAALEVALVIAAAVLDAAAALVIAAELAGEEMDSTVFVDSMTNGAE